jgi:hypothetical protein
MSVSRLVVGIIFLGLGIVFFRGRGRLRAPSEGTTRIRGRGLTLVSVLAWVYTLIGLLWVALAFA